MEPGTIKHFSIISGIIAHNFTENLIKHLNLNYFQAFEIIADLSLEVYKELEEHINTLEPIEYLDSVIITVKKILLTRYRINLISYAP